MAETKALSEVEKNALCVKYDVLGTTVSLDIDFVKKYLVRGKAELVTNQELVFFMNTCKMQRLNPLVGNEVYCIKYQTDEPAQLVVGKGAYMRRAYEHPEYICKEDGIVVQRGDKVVQKEGCCIYPTEQLLGGWCRVHYLRNGQERCCYKEVSLEEYDKGKASWKVKPATMINKVAISQCVRDAFPKDYEGLYSEEEMIASGAIPATGISENPMPEDYGKEEILGTVDRPITINERRELFACAQKVFGRDNANDYIKDALEELRVDNTAELTYSQYEGLISELDDMYNAQAEEQ